MLGYEYSIRESLRVLEVGYTAARINDSIKDEIHKLLDFAMSYCNAKHGFVSLIDDTTVSVISGIGMHSASIPREMSFCRSVLESHQAVLIDDLTTNEMFMRHPLVVEGGPQLRCYYGIPLRSSSGSILGTMCIFGHAARTLDSTELMILEEIATEVSITIGAI